MHPWKKDIQIPTTKLTHAQTLTYTRMHACMHTHILVYTHGRKAKGATACLAVGEGHLPSRPQADLRGRTREQDTTWIKHMASAMHPAPKCCRGRSTKRQNASMVGVQVCAYKCARRASVMHAAASVSNAGWLTHDRLMAETWLTHCLGELTHGDCWAAHSLRKPTHVAGWLIHGLTHSLSGLTHD